LLKASCAGSATSEAKDGAAPELRQEASLREKQTQRSSQYLDVTLLPAAANIINAKRMLRINSGSIVDW